MSEQAIKLIRKSLETKDAYLDLGNCGLTDKDFTKGTEIDKLLNQCTHVNVLILSSMWEEWELDLGYVQKTSKNRGEKNCLNNFPPALANFTCLKTFICAGDSFSQWQIKDMQLIQGIKTIERLNLRYNCIDKIKGLDTLCNLRQLDLSDNNISEIKGLDKLTNLQELDLSCNKISKIKGLNNLKSLLHLNIAQNKISSLTGLGFLKNLLRLNISENNITRIAGIDNLIALERLYISENKIKMLSDIDKLIELRFLDISQNEIEDITPLYPLLAREKNPFQIDSSFISISSRRVMLGGNPLITPPREVIIEGNDAVLRYFEKLRNEGYEKVYEAKMVLTGSGESGKTSLSLRLNKKNCQLPQKDERTKEVDVTDYHFKTDIGKDFTAHVWDFGGQQILHSFHRLFMNDSALYVLLTETSRENDDFDYWLQTIRLFGGNSPILFVQNKKNGIPRRLNISHYKEYFNIKDDLYEINLLNKNEGLKELESAIQRHIQQLPIVKRTIPRSWFRLRNNLQQIRTPFINYNEFVLICHKCNIKERIDIEDAGNFLHQLGIVLWYKENAALRDKIILERHWATKALFLLIFNDKINREQNGYFTKTDAQIIWDKETKADYKHHTSQLIALMQEFKLAYKQQDKIDAFIIPALLPSEQPKKVFKHDVRILITYEYLHLPRGIVNQLTANLYGKIEKDEYTWSEGVWLWIKDSNTEARIMENRVKKNITIEVAGIEFRELFGIIKNTLESIHKEYKGIQCQMKIPCVCEVCKKSEKKYSFAYETIIKRLSEGSKKTIECGESGCDIPLHTLLDNVLPQHEVDEIGELKKLMGRNFEKLHWDNVKTHSDLGIIKDKLSQQNTLILNLLTLTQSSKNELTELLEKVDAQYNDDQANSLLQKVDEVLAEHLEALPKRIAEEWQKLNTKSSSATEVKSMLKFKLPIIPFILDYEGEVSIDMKKIREKLRRIMI